MNLFVETAFWYTNNDTGLRPLLDELLNELRTPAPDCDQMVDCILRRIIIYLTRRYRESPSAMQISESQMSSPKPYITDEYLMLDEAFAYNYATLTLEDVASILHLSIRQTQRFFNVYFGKSFSQKKTEAQMTNAAQLLTETDQNITEISETVGFSSVEHFSAAFKRYYGVSPRSYRQSKGMLSGINTK